MEDTSILAVFEGYPLSDMFPHEMFSSLRFAEGMSTPPVKIVPQEDGSVTRHNLPTHCPAWDTLYRPVMHNNVWQLQKWKASTCKYANLVSFDNAHGEPASIVRCVTIPGEAAKPLTPNGLICLLNNDIPFAVVAPGDTDLKPQFWDPKQVITDLDEPLVDVAAAPRGAVLFGVGNRPNGSGFVAAMVPPGNPPPPGIDPSYNCVKNPGGVACSADGKYVVVVGSDGKKATVLCLQPSPAHGYDVDLETDGTYGTSGLYQFIDGTTCYVLLTRVTVRGYDYRSTIWKIDLENEKASRVDTSHADEVIEGIGMDPTGSVWVCSWIKDSDSWAQGVYNLDSPTTVYSTGEPTATTPNKSNTFAIRRLAWT
ncbi:hypothetical protein [Saccharothrix xinjiangensis]|uniref:Uncharacterized protein n=1 Tax=Saccharothrix xinjiangensis TaxID=204798 RepID=A0ABV9Y2M5_9PSEU